MRSDLISPQFVTPHVKSNENDRNDAEGISEAVGRPNMRFVPVKSAEQLAVQAVHRIRSRLVGDHVRLVNQIRGLLGEHGIVVSKAIGNLRQALARIVGDTEDRNISGLLRSLMAELNTELAELVGRRPPTSVVASEGITSRSRRRSRRPRSVFKNEGICVGPREMGGDLPAFVRKRRGIMAASWPQIKALLATPAKRT
jgi:hypothetical protein